MKLPAVALVAWLVTTTAGVTAIGWRARAAHRRRVERAEIAGSHVTAQPPALGSPTPPGARQPPGGAQGSSGARMLHGDARHTHRAVGRAPTRAVAVVWSHDVGGPVEAQVTTSVDEQTLYVASLGGSVTALARKDGSARWALDLGDRVYATPCVGADGTIYVGSDAKKFVAVSADGKIKWSFDTDGESDTAPVLTTDGSVVFAAGRMVYDLTALGQVKWRFAARRKVFASPALSPSGRVFFGAQDHRAYALTPQGTLLWSTDLTADVDGAPAIADDGAVFVGTDADEVVRLDPDDGAIRWRTTLGGFVRGTLSVARNGDVLAGVYGPTPRAVRLRADDGRLMSQFAIQGTGAREFGIHGGALEDDVGTLLFGAQDDAVYAVSAAGETLWHFTSGGDVDAPVTLLRDGAVVVGSDDGRVYLLQAK